MNMTDEQRWRLFRELIGYVQDGSGVFVTIGQDDATGDWVLKVGHSRTYYGRSVDEVLKAATK